MDDYAKVVIYTNVLKKNMKAMNELEEKHFGSLLKRIISKCNLKALLFEETQKSYQMESYKKISLYQEYTQKSAN